MPIYFKRGQTIITTFKLVTKKTNRIEKQNKSKILVINQHIFPTTTITHQQQQ